MSLFEGTAPPNVETSRTTTATAPQYLTNYLTDLAQAGQTQLGQPAEGLVAGLPQNLQDLYSSAQGTLGRYQAPLGAAAGMAQQAGQGISGQDISKFYDPYQQSVVDELARQSGLNVQRNVLPQMKAAFAGSGGFGSQRYAGAMGQALGDIESSLLGKQAEAMSSGYKTALDAALRQNAQSINAAQALGGIGATEAQAAPAAIKSLGDLGAQQLAYEQSKIEAPLTRAQNVAQIMRGYTYPTTTSEIYKGPANVYGPSPLSQIAGLGSLIGSAFNSPSGWGNQLLGGLKDIFKGVGGTDDQINQDILNSLNGQQYNYPDNPFPTNPANEGP